MTLARLIDHARALDLRANPAQRELSARLVTPRLGAILTLLGRIRAAVDEQFAPRVAAARAQATSVPLYGDRDWQTYPIGFCREIRDEALRRLALEPLIRELVAGGVVLKPVFIFLKQSYFQNAIQLGHFYLDVANDTVFPEKPKLDWAPLDRLDFENLESWSRFATVARTYLKIEIYPNLLFPLAFVASPFFAIRPNGRIEMLLAQHQIALKDLGDDLRRTRALLADEALMARRLPEPCRALLEEAFGANLYEVFPLEFAPRTPAEIGATIVEEFRALARAPDDRAFPVVKGYFEMVEKAAALLRGRDLRPATDMVAILRAEGAVPDGPGSAVGGTLD